MQGEAGNYWSPGMMLKQAERNWCILHKFVLLLIWHLGERPFNWKASNNSNGPLTPFGLCKIHLVSLIHIFLSVSTPANRWRTFFQRWRRLRLNFQAHWKKREAGKDSMLRIWRTGSRWCGKDEINSNHLYTGGWNGHCSDGGPGRKEKGFLD